MSLSKKMTAMQGKKGGGEIATKVAGNIRQDQAARNAGVSREAIERRLRGEVSETKDN